MMMVLLMKKISFCNVSLHMKFLLRLVLSSPFLSLSACDP